MSDGNYNRNLLPYNPYRSGLKAGGAQMKEKAVKAFSQIVSEHIYDLNESDIDGLVMKFKQLLEK